MAARNANHSAALTYRCFIFVNVSKIVLKFYCVFLRYTIVLFEKSRFSIPTYQIIFLDYSIFENFENQ